MHINGQAFEADANRDGKDCADQNCPGADIEQPGFKCHRYRQPGEVSGVILRIVVDQARPLPNAPEKRPR